MAKLERLPSTSSLKANERAAKVLDEIEANLVVLDQHGVIVATNRPWREFAAGNRLADGSLPKNTDVGSSYLDICLAASGAASESARTVHDGIRAVIDGRRSRFSHQYPCHGPAGQRWFVISAKPIRRSAPREVVVMHVDVTARYRAEIAAQAKQEELTAALAELQVMAAKIRQSMLLDAPSGKAESTTRQLHRGHHERSRERLAVLSKREMEVFLALVRGERNAEIAGRLQLSNKSISTYRARVLEKLGVENNAQLVTLSSQAGLTGGVQLLEK
jgi:DNA-binding CsgD family transcriptional regulator